MKNGLATDIIKLLLFALIIGGFSATIDYLRISNAEKPIFCLKEFDENTKKEEFTSLLYTAERQVRKNASEPLYRSKNIKYELFGIFDLKVPKKYFESNLDKKIVLTETDNCDGQSRLYYVDENIKIYTYCLDKIELDINDIKTDLLTELSKDSVKTISEIKSRLLVKKYLPNDLTIYESTDIDYSTNGLILYECNRENVKDYYIGSKNILQKEEFCTYKSDIPETNNSNVE